MHNLHAPGSLLLFFLPRICLLSCVCCRVGGAPMFWAWSEGGMHTNKAMICLPWVSNYVPAVEYFLCVWKGAQTRLQSASCASERAAGNAGSLSPYASMSTDGMSTVAQTPVRRTLCPTQWDWARLWDGRISNQQHLKIILSNGIQSAPWVI